MSCEAVVKVDGVGKQYLVYAQPQDRLKQALVPRTTKILNLISGKKRFLLPTYYKEVWALQDISFDIKKGETVGIIGVNGSGKSTLLQIICNTLQPTTGNVSTHGRIAALLELGAGFDPEYTGRQNVYLNAMIYGLSQNEIDTKFDSIAAFADIGDFLDRPIKMYSSGMYVRLAFAVIAHVNADILVIDEALAVGDVFFTQKCMRFLREFKENGTILFVSHDTSAVVNFCDRALWLAQGQLKEIGPAKDVSEHYLAGQYSRMQKIDLLPESSKTPVAKPDNSMGKTDMRLAYLDKIGLRNDIEVFEFKSGNRGFGSGGATIKSATIKDGEGKELSWIVGGERVQIELCGIAHEKIERVVLGFFFKDRLGQVLFGENTHTTYSENPVTVPVDGIIQAKFEFRMPILPPGSYTVDIAIADGTQDNHTQLCWLHDAIAIQSHSSSTTTGLVGIICDNIVLGTLDETV